MFVHGLFSAVLFFSFVAVHSASAQFIDVQALGNIHGPKKKQAPSIFLPPQVLVAESNPKLRIIGPYPSGCFDCNYEFENLPIGKSKLHNNGRFNPSPGTHYYVHGTISVTGDTADFTKSADTCSGITLTSSCSYKMTFAPASAGVKTVTVTIPSELYRYAIPPETEDEFIADTTVHDYYTGVGAEFDPLCKEPSVIGSEVNIPRMSMSESIPIVGTEFSLVYSSEFSADYLSPYNNLGVKDFFNPDGWTVSHVHYYDFGHRRLYRGDGTTEYVKFITIGSGAHFVLSRDASEAFIFDSTGKHTATWTSLTGASVRTFTYDGTSNRLTSIEDAYGNVTTFNRDGSGNLTSIEAPFGQETQVTVASSLITQVENPNSESHVFTYKTGTTLMETFTKPGGQVSTFTYDSNGRLIKDQGHGGNFWELTQDLMSPTKPVTMTSKMGRDTIVALGTGNGYSSAHSQPSGTFRNFATDEDGNISLSDNVSSAQVEVAFDERWQILHRRVASKVTTYDSVNSTKTLTQTVVNSSVTPNAFNFDSITQTETEGSDTLTKVYDASTKQWTITSAAGATEVLEIDSHERPVSFTQGSDTPWTFTYDSNGRLETISQGSHNTQTAVYNSAGYIETVTNVRSETTGFARDLAGRLTNVTLPDSRVISFSYDANGNMTGVTPPGRPLHSFTFNAFELPSAYEPPAIGISVPKNTTYVYNDDKQLTEIVRPDGLSLIFNYDSAKGVLNSITTPAGDYNYTYSNTTQLIESIETPAGMKNELTHYGPLLASDTVSGGCDDYIFGKVSFAYNSEHRLSARTIHGHSSGTTYTTDYTYNADKKLSAAGDLTLAYEYPSGRLSTTTLDTISDLRTYDTYGNLETYTAIHTPSIGSPVVLYSYTLSRDDAGRIEGKTENVLGTTTTYGYTYDTAGRLTGETVNTVPNSSFVYDDNSNRTSGTIDGVAFTASYDDQDRMTAFNSNTYTYNNNGDLTRIDYPMSAYSTYNYDVMGNLSSGRLTSGAVVEYFNDGFNRRSIKQISGNVQWRQIYEDKFRVAAVLDPSATVQKQFVFATHINAPDYMVVGSDKYFVITDHLGSPRLVVDSATGTVAQQMNYNVVGKITYDSNPGFQPYGFAGSIYDFDTGFFRFGARDYDPSTGRWTSKDPIRFEGSDTNLYGYVVSDPINLIDPSGTIGMPAISPLDGGTYDSSQNKCEQYKRCKKTIKKIKSCIPPFVFGPAGTYVRAFLTGYSMSACEPYSIEERKECAD